MKKPVIGILTNIITVEEGTYAGGERIYVNRDYVLQVLSAGGIPLLLPIVHDLKAIRQQIEHIDGLLLSGGQDVHPKYYNSEPSPWLGAVHDERDVFEMEAIKIAIERKIPLLGVCRGQQLINVAFGGTLYQDIPQEIKTSDLLHTQRESRQKATHRVEITPGSRLHAILGSTAIWTNSFHHQSVKECAPGFMVVAHASDGVVEGIEKSGDHFVLGVQWHPEMMSDEPGTKKLFEAFVSEALKYAKT